MNSLKILLGITSSFILISSILLASEVPDSATGLTLTIYPPPSQDAYPQGDAPGNGFVSFAIFSITLKNNEEPLTNNLLSISVEGPRSWSMQVETDNKGSYAYWIQIDSSITPVGVYKMTVSSKHGDEIISQETTFMVKAWMWD
jgi:hypothetical protein